MSRFFSGGFKAGFLIVSCMLLFASANLSSWMAPESVSQFMRYPGLGEEAAGFLLTVELSLIFLTIMVCSQFAGGFPYRLIAMVGLVLAVVGQFLSTEVVVFSHLIWLRAIVGIGIGLISAVAVMTLSSMPHAAKHFPKLYVFDMLSGSCLLFGMVWLKSLALKMGFESVFAIPGTLVLLVGVIALLGIPWKGRAALAPSSPAADKVTKRRGFANKSSALMVFGAYVFCLGSAITYTFSHLIGEHAGVDSNSVNSILGISTFFAIPGGLLCVFLAGRGNGVVSLVVICLIHALGNYLITHSSGGMPFGIGLLMSISSIYFLIPYLQGIGIRFDPAGGCSVAIMGAFPASFAVAGSLGGVLVTNVDVSTIGWIVVSLDIIATAFFLTAIAVFTKSSRSLLPEAEGQVASLGQH